MRTINIICTRYLNENGTSMTIGGVQTYISNLVELAKEINLSVCIFQFSNVAFIKEVNGVMVIGVNVSKEKTFSRKKKKVYKRCLESLNEEIDIIIYALERLAVKNKNVYSIGIQHGISWDIEDTNSVSRLNNIIYIYRRAFRAVSLSNDARNVSKLVCVDYNYINWYRTQIRHHEMDYEVIPNFTKIPENLPIKEYKGSVVRIIFARRFQPFRGTRLFSKVIQLLLEEYENLNVTFAGEGPDEEMLKTLFKNEIRVNFIKYSSEDSLQIHSAEHIAVIPTIGSEGTSLSLLEAMASKCAVVCTNIGGMTNVVLSGYNGLMVNPNEVALYEALKYLIENQKMIEVLGERAQNTVSNAFSHELWKEKWKKVLLENKSINN